MKLLIVCPNTAMMNAVCTCTLLPNRYIYYYMHMGIFHCRYANYTTRMHIELLRVGILLHVCVKLLIACPNTAMMSAVCIWILLPNQYIYYYMYIRIMHCRHVNITKWMHIELARRNFTTRMRQASDRMLQNCHDECGVHMNVTT